MNPTFLCIRPFIIIQFFIVNSFTIDVKLRINFNISSIYGERIDNDELDNYEWSNTQKGWIHKRSGAYVISALDFLSYDYLKDPKNGFTLSDKNDWIKIEK